METTNAATVTPEQITITLDPESFVGEGETWDGIDRDATLDNYAEQVGTAIISAYPEVWVEVKFATVYATKIDVIFPRLPAQDDDAWLQILRGEEEIKSTVQDIYEQVYQLGTFWADAE